MNCPQCGCEMQFGYVSAGGYRVVWSPKEHKLINSPGKDGVLLTKSSLSGRGAPAYLCRRCRTVLVQYEANYD